MVELKGQVKKKIDYFVKQGGKFTIKADPEEQISQTQSDMIRYLSQSLNKKNELNPSKIEHFFENLENEIFEQNTANEKELEEEEPPEDFTKRSKDVLKQLEKMRKKEELYRKMNL